MLLLLCMDGGNTSRKRLTRSVSLGVRFVGGGLLTHLLIVVTTTAPTAAQEWTEMLTMSEYIDKSALYEKIAQLEELARDRYLETPSNSPCYSRYMTQLNERTTFKHIVSDFPAADVAPVVHGRWIGRPLCGNDNCRCSECGSWHNIHANLRGEITQKYCPNCGARMDGE